MRVVNNYVKLNSELPQSSAFFTLGRGNPLKYVVEGNIFDVKGKNVRSLGGVLGLKHNQSQPQVFLENNCGIGDSSKDLPGPTRWVGVNLAQVVASGRNQMLGRSDAHLCKNIVPTQPTQPTQPAQRTQPTQPTQPQLPRTPQKLGVYV